MELEERLQEMENEKQNKEFIRLKKKVFREALGYANELIESNYSAPFNIRMLAQSNPLEKLAVGHKNMLSAIETGNHNNYERAARMFSMAAYLAGKAPYPVKADEIRVMAKSRLYKLAESALQREGLRYETVKSVNDTVKFMKTL